MGTLWSDDPVTDLPFDRSVLPLDVRTSTADARLRSALTTSGAPGARAGGYDPIRPVRPPQEAPNVVVVLIDDMGFGASSAYGGPCEMPTADRLAARGLRYSRFHVTALCSPTRQALMTGRNHHSVGMGVTSEMSTLEPGYTGYRPASAATIAQILCNNGYSTAAFGKWHQTPPVEVTASGPFTRWPTGEGFDRFYGFLGAEMNHWYPQLYDGTTPVEPTRLPEDGYHLTEDLVDHAVDWVQSQQTLTPDKPFFTYLALGATHAPFHVPRAWREKVGAEIDWTWSFRLAELPGGRTRLQLRVRGRTAPRWLTATYVATIIPADYIMSGGMLSGIKRRAESSAPPKVSGRSPLAAPNAAAE